MNLRDISSVLCHEVKSNVGAKKYTDIRNKHLTLQNSKINLRAIHKRNTLLYFLEILADKF